ncbi:HEAT repeat domain-containing protein [Negadavirga shengliensis]|uniref:HEAT repeat domain-containing protein n=1 Tax=Negadavirga shengliensis TaxID=1389218 RepID=A0ABV9T5G2_9BACT
MITHLQRFLIGGMVLFLFFSCKKSPEDLRIKTVSPERAEQLAGLVEEMVKPELHEDLEMKIWAVDSLVADPISIQVDDLGRVFYSRTNRRKISEFDIRSHQDWEIASISMQTTEDRRAFLHQELSPENSHKNEWLPDINQDGSHDWRDLTVEKENVYRLEDTDGDGLADRAQLTVEDFHEEITDVAGAVMYHDDALFVGVAPDLWRMEDTNGDGLMDAKTSLAHGFGVHIGFGGHNMSGLKVGPEGKIYWGIGDIGFNGEDGDGNKHEYPNCGVIARANPDGSDFEIFAYGVRNTHEFAFDDFGNLISVDNDGDHRGERERIVYLVEGSDTGWRINWQFGKYRDPKNNPYKVWMEENMHTPRSDDQAAYFIPAIANYINGPTGMVYNPGTALGSKWKNTFFVAEFAGNPARSGIHAFKLNPKGAGFELAETQQIMGGTLATGMDFAPDGSLYFADWIDGWVNKGYGRIWKLDDQKSDNREIRKSTAENLAKDFGGLEISELEYFLSHEDKRLRQKAQFELAKRGDKSLEAFERQLDQTDNRLARIHAIWGISQLARKQEKHAAVLVPYLNDQDGEIRAQAARWLGDIRYEGAADGLITLLKDPEPRVRFFAAEALGRIGHKKALSSIVTMLEENDDQDVYLRHAGSLALSRMGDASSVVALKDHPSRAVRLAAVVALRRMKDPGIASFLEDKDEYIVAEAARAINDDTSIPDALEALGAVLKDNRFRSEPLLRRAINANFRTGTQEALNNLLEFAARQDAPKNMRMETLDALGTWADPSVLDRVDGWYRGEMKRDAGLVRKVASGTLMNLINHQDKDLRIAAVNAIGLLGIEGGTDRLLSKLKTDPNAEVREASLRSMAVMNGVAMDKAIETALSDSDKNVRVAGLDLMEKLDIPDATKAELLADVIEKRTIEEQQAALLTLAKVEKPSSEPIFSQILDKLEAGDVSPAIELELHEALEMMDADKLLSRYDKIKASLSEDELLASYSGSMYGGDVSKGRRIFFQHPTGQCIKCHAYDDFGGNAGPRLNGIAGELSRQELLEALIDPSKRLAPGFGVVTLRLKDDKKVAGIKAEENNNTIKIKIGNQPDTVVLKEHIVERRDAPSSMPDMKEYLTRREIRDLVSFLATLKEKDS